MTTIFICIMINSQFRLNLEKAAINQSNPASHINP